MATLSLWEGQPFKWGELDCCQLIALSVGALTGTNLAEQFGEYSTEREALRMVAFHRSLRGLLEHALGYPNEAVAIGDPMLLHYQGERWDTIGAVYCRPGCAFVVDREHGLMRQRFAACDVAAGWSF
ncbi:MAG: hypothetical protein AAF515_05025 [Pseudomonadota bacterium]